MLVPFFLGIEAIPVFYVAHSRDYIRGAFGHGNAVAQLDQPVIIIVIKGSDEVQYPLIIRFRNIRLSDIGMYILFGEGMGKADTRGFIEAQLHEIVVAIDDMGQLCHAEASSDIMEKAEDCLLYTSRCV